MSNLAFPIDSNELKMMLRKGILFYDIYNNYIYHRIVHNEECISIKLLFPTFIFIYSTILVHSCIYQYYHNIVLIKFLNIYECMHVWSIITELSISQQHINIQNYHHDIIIGHHHIFV